MANIALGDTAIEISRLAPAWMRFGGSGRGETFACPVKNGPLPDGGCRCS